jgi:membrane protease YdiL (CAAX protease family)
MDAASASHRALIGWIALAAAPVAWCANQFLGLRLQPGNTGAWAWSLLLAPVLEEIAFRTLLQRGFQARLQAWLTQSPSGRDTLVAKPWLAGLGANSLTALAFAAVHAPSQGWVAVWWMIPALAIGEVWRQKPRVLPCIALHAWFNACLAGVSLALG